MKVISLLQPWASLVILGHKKIETRSFSTPYRGELLIHASLGCTTFQKELSKTSPFFKPLREAGYKFYGVQGARKQSDTLPRGYIIGKVNLREVLPSHIILHNLDLFQKDGKAAENEKAFGDYSPNRFGWLLSDIEKFENPIPAKGCLGLWNWEGGT